MASQIELAEAQFTGWGMGRSFTDITPLIESMGLTKREWLQIKERDHVLGYLNPSEILAINNYFKIK